MILPFWKKEHTPMIFAALDSPMILPKNCRQILTFPWGFLKNHVNAKIRWSRIIDLLFSHWPIHHLGDPEGLKALICRILGHRWKARQESANLESIHIQDYRSLFFCQRDPFHQCIGNSIYIFHSWILRKRSINLCIRTT